MAQHDYIIANQSGAAFRSDLNNGLAAIVSNNSGAAQPSTTYAYQWWADTTTGLLKLRNAANNAWITIGTLASANLGLLPLSGGTMTGNITFPGAGGLVSVGSLYLKGNDATAPVRFLDGASNQIAYISNSGYFTGQGVINLTEQCLIQGNNATTPIRFNDGAGNQIAYITNSGVINAAGLSLTGNITVPSLNGGPLAGFRNRIINGNFDIWQRGTSFSNPSIGAYTADRWLVFYDGSGATRTISRQSFALGQTDVPSEPEYFLRFAQSVAGSGSTLNSLDQRIEGVRSFAGQQVTVSFWAKAATNTTMPSVQLLQSFGVGGSSPVYTTVVSNVALTTSWQRFSYQVNVPSISGKTIGTSDSLVLILTMPLNATFTVDIAQVQIEPGAVATPFEQRPIGTELALCQRYFEVGTSAWTGYAAAGIGVGAHVSYAATKRAVPTVTTTPFGYTNASGSSVANNTIYGFMPFGTTTALGGVIVYNSFTASAEL